MSASGYFRYGYLPGHTANPAKDQNLHKLRDEAKITNGGLWKLPEAQRMQPWECKDGKNVVISLSLAVVFLDPITLTHSDNHA